MLSILGALILAGSTAAAVNLMNVPRAEDAIRDRDLPSLAGSFAPGDALRISLGDMKDITGQWSVVFPRSAAAAAAPFMAPRPYDSNAYSDMARELQAGAYAVDGLRMEVTIEGNRNQELRILNIRPVAQAEPIVDGPSIYMGTEGGGATDHLAFDLDSPQPVAQEVDYVSPDRPFFDVRKITLKSTETDALTLDLSAVNRAYSFVIAFDYEVGGQRFTQNLDKHGAPFRVTPSLCSKPIDTQHAIPPSVLAERAARHYSQVLYSRADPETYSCSLVPGNPASFCDDTSQVAR